MDDGIEPRYLYTDGTPVVQGHCVMPDHHLTTFSVSVRTMDGVTANRLREIIQRELEVVEFARTAQVIYCRKR